MTPLPVTELQRTRTGMRDPPVLSAFKNKDVILRLPLGTKIRDIRWLSVWCRRFTVSNVPYTLWTNTVPTSKPTKRYPGTTTKRHSARISVRGIFHSQEQKSLILVWVRAVVPRARIQIPEISNPDLVPTPEYKYSFTPELNKRDFLVHFTLVQSECRVALLTHWISLFPLASLGVQVPASLAGFYCEQISIPTRTTTEKNTIVGILIELNLLERVVCFVVQL
uniref:DM13 domain-containing protein n=1 Tax=Timema cristinae TaxID=61476 RepID=A0A7R9CF75_TIMCR|nr:unnamed protein product [Timema cristinae]